jgi:mono/diheme cytochrome c family protein
MTTNSVLARRSVCHAPRGLAYDASADGLIVACLEGALVELPAAGGPATRVTNVAVDLRDVAFVGKQLVVSRFRSAELLYLDENRQISSTVKLPGTTDFDASVAWRMLSISNDTLAVAHQRSFSGRIEVIGGGGTSAGTGGTSGVGGTAGIAGKAGSDFGPGGEGGAVGEINQSGYGSEFSPCSSVVEGTFSLVSADGSIRTAPNLDGAVLPVDIAANSDIVAIAFAGANSTGSGVGVYPMDSPFNEKGRSSCLGSQIPVGAPGAVAVAIDQQTNRLVVQQRDPAGLGVIDLATGLPVGVIPLGGDSVTDTGHDLFHTDAGNGIACASCHPEGTEDGRVWNFSDVGARRTQPLDVGLAGTAPFHWDGELVDFSALMDRIFVGRMGGAIESEARQQALEEYVYTLPRRPAVRDAGDAAAERGKTIFQSTSTGCTTCHTGPNLSTGSFAAIGKGPALQIPSLIAVGARAPYMHDGCAATLRERFDPSCGGTAHGDTSALTSDQIGDLVAYLETL